MARNFLVPIDMSGNQIVGLPLIPILNDEAASKKYVDTTAGEGGDVVSADNILANQVFS